MLQVFGRLFQQIEGRLKAEMVRRIVVQLVDLWEKWAAFSRLLCQNYRELFTLSRHEDLTESEGDVGDEEEENPGIDGVPLNVDLFYSSDLVNTNIDGDPIFVNSRG